VHGNLTALDAVVDDLDRRDVETVVHGGDLAAAGSQGAEVVDRIRELRWPGVVGNTDEMLWRPEEHETQVLKAPRLAPLLALLFEVYVPATCERLGEERLDWLRGLPAEHRDGDMVVVHAGPGDLWRAPAADAGDDELRATYDPLGGRLAVYGHIHRPFVRELDADWVVANSGSAGSPFDGDPRASYLLVEDGRASVIRVDYDIEREVAQLLGSGYPDAERIAEMRRSGRFVPVRI
jgi:predicted phosphodiesterase